MFKDERTAEQEEAEKRGQQLLCSMSNAHFKAIHDS
jgi:hypothetical protein